MLIGLRPIANSAISQSQKSQSASILHSMGATPAATIKFSGLANVAKPAAELSLSLLKGTLKGDEKAVTRWGKNPASPILKIIREVQEIADSTVKGGTKKTQRVRVQIGKHNAPTLTNWNNYRFHLHKNIDAIHWNGQRYQLTDRPGDLAKNLQTILNSGQPFFKGGPRLLGLEKDGQVIMLQIPNGRHLAETQNIEQLFARQFDLKPEEVLPATVTPGLQQRGMVIRPAEQKLAPIVSSIQDINNAKRIVVQYADEALQHEKVKDNPEAIAHIQDLKQKALNSMNPVKIQEYGAIITEEVNLGEEKVQGVAKSTASATAGLRAALGTEAAEDIQIEGQHQPDANSNANQEEDDFTD